MGDDIDRCHMCHRWYDVEPKGYKYSQWVLCSQCTSGYSYLECPRCGSEVCRSCSSRCERCQKEECNKCGLGQDFRCRQEARIAGNAAQGRSVQARMPSSDGVPRSREVSWATVGGRRLDVESASGWGKRQLLQLRWRLQLLRPPVGSLGEDVLLGSPKVEP